MFLEAPLYVQITTRCNMRCIHCCSSCTAIGEDMSFSTFKKAIDSALSLEYGEILIGGGEPTLHPRLLDMVRYVNSQISMPKFYTDLSMITNGTCDKSLWSRLIRFKRLKIDVSKDIFHDTSKIKPWVREWADRLDHRWNDYDNSYTIELEGRAKKNRKRIRALCRKKGYLIDFVEPYISGVNVTPSGIVTQDQGPTQVPIGQVSKKTIATAYEGLQ
jgi:hypothetical protein